ncbi:unnamed protein product [Schistosoma curassoni]|uniref:Stc1 domain-containing protein n=1 Tax=Schistosoma curassoni TaxID=6186 RepID=A0A183KPF5_9TREM|nr:unnamed protein product [Schistosoma curassoni]
MSCEECHKSVKRLSYGKFPSRNSCVFRNAKCFKCGKIGHTPAVFNATNHFAASIAKLCDSDSIKLNVSKESYSDQIHDIILPDMHCSHDSCIFNETIYKFEKDIWSASNPDQYSDVILSNVFCPNDSFISSEIKCEEQVLDGLKSEYSPDGVAPDVILHNRNVEHRQSLDAGEFVPISVVNSNTSENILDHTETTFNTQFDRHTIKLGRCSIDYQNLDSNLICGGCGICMNQ